MKDLTSLNPLEFFSSLPQKTKIILAASSIAAFTAAPVIYVVSSSPKVIETKQQEVENDVKGSFQDYLEKDRKDREETPFVMGEDFYSDSENLEKEDVSAKDNNQSTQEQFRETPVTTTQNSIQPPATLKTEQLFTDGPKPLLNENRQNPTLEKPKPKQKTLYVNHAPEDRSEKVLELLADKDFPSTIASEPYDLSRLLTTDTFIPAVMYTGVNSEIPSKTVLAVVESDVTGFHGRNILIPKGSKIEGVYEKIDNKHARRMQITWFKITRPDGIIIKLNAESSDMQGAGGLTGYLDQRLKDRYGGALLLSTINALAQMSVKENDIRQLAAAEAYSREFGTLTAQIIRENINAMPVIMIRQGARFNIRPYENIYFPKPSDKKIQAFFTNNN